MLIWIMTAIWIWVLNNMDETASLYENTLSGASTNYLRLKVGGYARNSLGVGTKVTVHTDEGIQYQELHTARGYISSVEPVLHFGLGATEKVNSVEVEWLDGTIQVMDNVAINTTVELKHEKGNASAINRDLASTVFKDITDSILAFKHKEIPANDFATEVLLPNKLSQSGPFIAEGDINGDGLQDIYITGPYDGVGQMMLQTKDGFKK